MENLLQTVRMQLSKNHQILSDLFTPLFKSAFDFKHFEKKGDPHNLCISEIIDWRDMVRNCLRSPTSEQPRIVNILKDPQHCWNLRDSSFLIFFQHS